MISHPEMFTVVDGLYSQKTAPEMILYFYFRVQLHLDIDQVAQLAQ